MIDEYEKLKKEVCKGKPMIKKLLDSAEEHGELTFAEGIGRILEETGLDMVKFMDELLKFTQERREHYHHE